MDGSVQEGWVQEGLGTSRGHSPTEIWRDREIRAANDAQETVPGLRPAADSADERLSRLARAIELEIIPRLMLAHRVAEQCPVVPALETRSVTQEDVEGFAKLVLGNDDALPLACLEAMRARGVSVETLYLDLLAPTARYLGHLWDEDLCDFSEVTVGLGRLQQVMRELSPAFSHVDDQPANGWRALLLPSPGEQHTFGLVMVAEFFRRAGWDVGGGPWETALEAERMVAADWYDVIGFSLGSEGHLDALRACIAAVRRASRNPRIGIMVGGPIFAEHPEFVKWVGADASASDGRQAPVVAEHFIDERSKPG